MRNIELLKQQQKIDSLFDLAKLLQNNVEVLSHWSRYLCVLISGFIENSVAVLFRQYVSRNTNKRISSYVYNNLRKFHNPKMNNILELLGFFDRGWRETLKDATDGELKDAIDSIVDNRNKIAHGENVGISMVRVKDYYKRSIKVINKIEDIIETK